MYVMKSIYHGIVNLNGRTYTIRCQSQSRSSGLEHIYLLYTDFHPMVSTPISVRQRDNKWWLNSKINATGHTGQLVMALFRIILFDKGILYISNDMNRTKKYSNFCRSFIHYNDSKYKTNMYNYCSVGNNNYCIMLNV